MKKISRIVGVALLILFGVQVSFYVADIHPRYWFGGNDDYRSLCNEIGKKYQYRKDVHWCYFPEMQSRDFDRAVYAQCVAIGGHPTSRPGLDCLASKDTSCAVPAIPLPTPYCIIGSGENTTED